MSQFEAEDRLDDGTRQSSEELDEGAESLRRFQASISKFGFTGSSSARKQSLTKAVSGKSGLTSPLTSTGTTTASSTKSFASQSSKRPRPEDDSRLPLSKLDASPSKKSKGKRSARGYASPEVYAHLNPVNDCLSESLDIVFCGVNPGQRSAETGHHFGHPSNHFWKCLHLSGLTSERIPPSEDFTVLERFQLGLTNIIDRPTAEASELKELEFKEGIAPLLAKVARYRPRILCFIGLQVGRIMLNHVMRARARKDRPVFSPGLQPYKLVHPKSSSEVLPNSPETLFYALPSTSGIVQGYQIPDKVKLFTELKDDLQRLKEGSLTSTINFIELVD